MFSLTSVDYALWIATALLELGIAIQMMRNRAYAEFPIFFSSMVFEFLRFVLLFSLHNPYSYKAYFVTYWITDLLGIGVGIAVIYELYSHAFKPYSALRRLGNLLFLWGAVVILVLAAIAAAAAPGGDSDRLIAGLLVLSRSSSFIRGGLLLFLFLFTRYFGLTWRHYAIGIALGLGLHTSVDLAAVGTRAQFGIIAAHTYSLVSASAYFCALMVWMSYFLKAEPAAKRIDSVPTNELEHWNQALLQLLYR